MKIKAYLKVIRKRRNDSVQNFKIKMLNKMFSKRVVILNKLLLLISDF